MRYFIADTHFGHEKVMQVMLRCFPESGVLFPTVEAHDDHLIHAINSVVGRDDELFVLGDFCLKKPGKYRMRINCKHVRLIRGNHDPYQKSKNVFGEIPYIVHTKVRYNEIDMRVVLCHTPMAYWDGSHKGWGHLYGHTHDQREHTMDEALGYQRRSMDVGVDSLFDRFGHYAPVSEEYIYKLFTNRMGHDPVSYYHDYQGAREARFLNERTP